MPRAVPGSMKVALHVLRSYAASLDRDKRYLIYCGTGIESAIVTFSLAELGFEAAYLEGGLSGIHSIGSAPSFPRTLS